MQGSQQRKEDSYGVKQLTQLQCLTIFLVHEQNSAPPYTMFYGKDAKYAKHLQTFGEISVTADTFNKVGNSKLDTRGRLSMFMGYNIHMLMGYNIQHTGDVYRLLHLWTNHVIYSRHVQWQGKMWNEFYNIPSTHIADAYVYPFDDYIENTGTDQEAESNVREVEPPPIETEETCLEEEEPIAATTRSHESEPIASRTRSQKDMTEIARLADVKSGCNLHEWDK